MTGFTPVPGTLGTLTALENTSLLILSGAQEDELADDETLAVYDPQLFRYTMLDGTRSISIGRKASSGSPTPTATRHVRADGIVHSAGPRSR